MPTTATRYFPYAGTGPGSNSGEAEWREMAKHWIADGLISTIGTAMAVTATTGMVLQAGIGAGSIQGNHFAFDTTTNITIAAAHATLARIDRVILRNDLTNKRIEVDVLTGTPDASPVAPSLTQTSATWEISLATVAVAAATTTLVSGNITDARTVITPYNGLLPSTAPPVLSSSTSAVGTSTTPARSDHSHGIGTPSAPPVLSSATSAAGSSGTPARSDHNHGIGTPSAPPVISSSTSSAGTAGTPALSDHSHGIGTPSAPPVLSSATSAAGSSGTPARSDHSHGIDDHAAWTAWTPTWVASGTQPVLNNGSFAGSAYLLQGKTLKLRIVLTIGSSTTFGTGYWSFTLPAGLSSVVYQMSPPGGCAFDTSASKYWPHAIIVPSGTSLLVYAVASATDPRTDGNFILAPAVPFTWAVGDVLYITTEFEVA